MKIRNLLILGLVLMGFTYCSSDEVLPGATDNDGKGVQMQLVVNMPTGMSTRSTTGATSTELGTEDGTLNENKVNSVLVAIFDTNENLKATHLCTAITGTGSPFITEKFAIPSLVVGQQYWVYAFVNPYDGLEANILSAGLEGKFGAKGSLALTIDAITRVGGVSGDNQSNFFMSNSAKVQTDPVAYTHIEGTPLAVNVSVQRAVARMDYVANSTAAPANTYKVGTSGVNVEFTHYKLINTSKSFYNLKRVNDGSSVPAATDFTGIGQPELVNNYIVDTDWENKIKTMPTDWTGGFFNYMGTTVTDNYKTLDVKSYVTENTIPANNRSKKGLATAVVFKGNLVFDDSYYTDSSAKDVSVYVWNNKFYGDFGKLPQAIQNIGETNTAALASAGVTGYSKVDDVYPVYYVYYNRHNDNNNPQETGPMEFAVVRNNIYKLTINSLSKFGHPNDPEGLNSPNPDPTPEKPGDPIESADLYMQVTATVLDWTVRTNAIDF